MEKLSNSHGGPSRALTWAALLCLLLSGTGSPNLYAVVGVAERYDEFKEQELEEFHSGILPGTEGRQMMPETPESLETVMFPATEQTQAYDEEMARLKKEILRLPERDRVKFGLDGQYMYESNIQRRPLRNEKGDSVFDTNGFVEFDIGGRKTDLRSEWRAGKQWNVHFSENDFYQVEERLRYRRRYFRKITHSVQSRIARHSSKTVEINEKKVRWDSQQNTAFNYEFSRKLSMNLELNALKRLFTTEAFDQDSQWQVTASPAVFWHITPKSRVALAYTFGASRIRTEVSDANSHEVHLTYFGQVTRKSSLSFDIALSHQSPRSELAPEVNTLTVGAGYIWQLTPKTQLTVQLLRSIQDTTSNLVTGTEDETTKQDAYYSNDSLSVSLNSRLHQKLTAIVTTGISHLRTKAPEGGDQDIEGRQMMFPNSIALNYMFKRWMQFRIRYSFVYRTGSEKADSFRSHQLMTGVNMNF